MANFFVRSRITTTWAATHSYSTLGVKVVTLAGTNYFGICFEVTATGTSGASEPSWNTTVGGTTTDSGVTWTTRGNAGIWLASKTYNVGDRVCKVSQSSLTSASSCVWQCTTAGTSNTSEPSWPTTITSGTTTQTDNTVTWTAEACSSWDNANPFICALLKDASNSTIKVSAGDTIYASKYHNEQTALSFANVDVQFPGSPTNPNRLICVDDTGQNGAGSLNVATGGTIATSASGSFSDLVVEGYAYIYGMTITDNVRNTYLGAKNISSGLYLDNCSLVNALTATGDTNQIFLGASASALRSWVVLNNTTASHGNTAQSIAVGGGYVTWQNTASALLGTIPNTLIGNFSGTSMPGSLVIDGVDLSAIISGNSVIGQNGLNTSSLKITLNNVKLASGASVTSGTNGGIGANITDAISVDSGGTNYKVHRDHFGGTLDQSTATYLSTGATDGTTNISWKIVTNTTPIWPIAFESFPIVVDCYGVTTGVSHTATVQIICDSATNLNNDDIWLKVQYYADSADPLGGFVSSSKANVLAANAALSSSAASWTGTGGMTHPNAQYLQVNFTPQQAGYAVATIYVAKQSLTVYVDPVVTVV